MNFLRLAVFSLLMILISSCTQTKFVYENGDSVVYDKYLKRSIRVPPTVFPPSYLSSFMREYISTYRPKSLGLAADIGTGSGVYAYLLAEKNFKTVFATDINPKAIEATKINSKYFEMDEIIEPILTKESDPVFAFLNKQKLDFVVLNPPWEDRKARNTAEKAKYDSQHKFLSAFLKGLPDALAQDGEAFIVLGSKSSQDRLKELTSSLSLKYEIVMEKKYNFGINPIVILYKVTHF